MKTTMDQEGANESQKGGSFGAWKVFSSIFSWLSVQKLNPKAKSIRNCTFEEEVAKSRRLCIYGFPNPESQEIE
jgi:hypothetical protein